MADVRIRNWGLTGSLLVGLAVLPPDAAFAHKPQRPDRAWPKHGGIVESVADIRVELVAAADRLAFYLRDARDRPLPLTATQASVLVLRGGIVFKLSLRDEAGHLVGDADLSHAGPFRVIVRLSLPDRPPASVVFGPINLSEPS